MGLNTNMFFRVKCWEEKHLADSHLKKTDIKVLTQGVSKWELLHSHVKSGFSLHGFSEWRLRIPILTGSWLGHALGCHCLRDASFQILCWKLIFNMVISTSKLFKLGLHEEGFVLLSETSPPGCLSQRQDEDPCPTHSPNNDLRSKVAHFYLT